jgi:hypothetical protein
MKRLALLGMAALGLASGIAACGSSPVEPGPTIAAVESPLFAKKTSSPSCENLVYPTSLCYPQNRPALCAALRNGGEFAHPVVGRPATETFARNAENTGSVETVTIPRPYGLPPSVLTFRISDSQIESASLCLRVA